MFLVGILFVAATALAIFTGVKMGQFNREDKEHPKHKAVNTDNICLSKDCVNTGWLYIDAAYLILGSCNSPHNGIGNRCRVDLKPRNY